MKRAGFDSRARGESGSVVERGSKGRRGVVKGKETNRNFPRISAKRHFQSRLSRFRRSPAASHPRHVVVLSAPTVAAVVFRPECRPLARISASATATAAAAVRPAREDRPATNYRAITRFSHRPLAACLPLRSPGTLDPLDARRSVLQAGSVRRSARIAHFPLICILLGVNCNVCTNDRSCTVLATTSAVGSASNSGGLASSGGNNEITCSTSQFTYTQGFVSCNVIVSRECTAQLRRVIATKNAESRG